LTVRPLKVVQRGQRTARGDLEDRTQVVILVPACGPVEVPVGALPSVPSKLCSVVSVPPGVILNTVPPKPDAAPPKLVVP